MLRSRSFFVMALLVSTCALAQPWPKLKTLPVRGGGEKDAAVVVGIENYAYVGKVPGAVENAKDWFVYFTKTLGVPAPKVKLLLDDDAINVSMLSAASEMAARVEPGGTLWFVFIGHGAPSEDGKDGVLVGADAQQSVQSLFSRSVKQRELLAALANGKQARTVAVIDACFSGRGTTGSYIAEGLQPLLVVPQVKAANALVLTAGTSKQFAGPLPGANRPAFSYLMLGGLRGWADANLDGNVTAVEAVQYATDALSTVLKGRQQTPEVNPAEKGGLVLAAPGKAHEETGPDLADIQLALAGSAGGRVAPASTIETPPAPVVAMVGPAVKKGKVVEPVGDLTIMAKPKELVRLEVTDPSGETTVSGSPYKNPAADVGRWKVFARATGYEEALQEFAVPPDEVTAIKVELKQLGGLSVTGPAGSAFKVTGPAGFSDEGGLPYEVSTGLRSGGYHLTVTRKGYEKFEQDVAVEPGKVASVAVELRKEFSVGALRGGTGGCPAGMAFIPGGKYTMSATHEPATVAPFCLAVTEVTVEAYAACVKSGQCSAPATGGSCNWNVSGRENHPVNCVDWNQAVIYCEGQGKRLPTEQEWEWAARGAEKGTEYPWGNDLPSNQACWNGEGNDVGKGNRWKTCPVGSYPRGASPQGVMDLMGNVCEWTSGADDSSDQVYRGGGWDYSDPRLHAARRYGIGPEYLNPYVGFRCARTR